MVANTQTYEIVNFGNGLNFRDDEILLEIGETPNAQNYEIVRKSGLQKRVGWENLFENDIENIDITYAEGYTNDNGDYNYVSISYPDIWLIDPRNGTPKNIAPNNLVSTGDPIGVEHQGGFFLVDEENAPRYIQGETVTTASWPPVYTHDNNAEGNVDDSTYTVGSNPAAADIDFPGLVASYANRIFVAGDKLNPRRLYASKIGDPTDFSSNNPLEFDIAFFVDVPTQRPITALKVISNRFLVVYCDTEIVLLNGEYPPGTAYPQPHFSFRTLNTEIGCIGKRLVAAKGDNDHYFVSNRGRVFQLSLTDNFQDVKPFGLTDRIFPLLAQYDNDLFKRGHLINDFQRGEVHFFLPDNKLCRYPNQDLVLNYGDKPAADVWSRDRDFNQVTIRNALIDRETNDLILVTPKNFVKTNSGTSFVGQSIKTVYQVRTLDLGAPDNYKTVTYITIYARSKTGAKIRLLHAWESGKSGVTEIDIPANPDSFFGDASFGVNDFQSAAGLPFQAIKKEILNPTGRLLKIKILSESDSEDFTINRILIGYKLQGKE